MEISAKLFGDTIEIYYRIRVVILNKIQLLSIFEGVPEIFTEGPKFFGPLTVVKFYNLGCSKVLKYLELGHRI